MIPYIPLCLQSQSLGQSTHTKQSVFQNRSTDLVIGHLQSFALITSAILALSPKAINDSEGIFQSRSLMDAIHHTIKRVSPLPTTCLMCGFNKCLSLSMFLHAYALSLLSLACHKLDPFSKIELTHATHKSLISEVNCVVFWGYKQQSQSKIPKIKASCKIGNAYIRAGHFCSISMPSLTCPRKSRTLACYNFKYFLWQDKDPSPVSNHAIHS